MRAHLRNGLAGKFGRIFGSTVLTTSFIVATGLASAGLINKTTAGRTGETLPLSVAVAIGMADGSKHVYFRSVNVVCKAAQGKSGKAAKAK